MKISDVLNLLAQAGAPPKIEVPVLADRFALAWPEHEGQPCSCGKSDCRGVDERDEIAYDSLAEVLVAQFPFDAHFAAYSVPATARRLGVNSASRLGRVPVVLAIFDVDDPDKTGGQARADWWAAERLKLARISEAHPNPFAYRTRGGYRLLWRLPRPVYIFDDTDAAAWRSLYCAWLHYLNRRFEIVGDRACKDWTRLYRLPHATRDEGGTPEELDVIGDVRRIGLWSPELTGEDTIEPRATRPTALPIAGVASLLDDPEQRDAAVTLIAFHFPRKRRHDFALALGSVLARHSQLDAGRAEAFVRDVATAGGSDNPRARARDAAHSYRTISDGRAATGIPTLREIVGDAAAEKIVEALSDRQARDREMWERILEGKKASERRPRVTATEALKAIEEGRSPGVLVDCANESEATDVLRALIRTACR